MTQRPVLSMRGLRFHYARSVDELFDGLDHDFTPGRLTALTGPSGRGKSTLLYILGLMLTPTGGCVDLSGQAVSGLSDAARSLIRATRIGFVFQNAELDPHRTILDAVCEPALYAGRAVREVRGRARELLRRFGLDHRADYRPGQISGGQAQRVAICRSLINDPGIVLADEPTGNLDRDNADLVLRALRATAEDGTTVVIATHDPYVLDASDEVVRL